MIDARRSAGGGALGRRAPDQAQTQRDIGEDIDDPVDLRFGMRFYELNDLVQTWFGLVVHAKTPPEVADRLRTAAQNALKAPETLTRFAQLAATPLGTGSAEFSQQISTQLARNRAIAKRAAIQVD